MSIQPVKKMGNKQLGTPSSPIEQFATSELFEIIKDMQDTMLEENGVGIAAPQIGQNKRIIMFGFEKSERYPEEEAVPFTVLINPIIEFLTNETVDGWEGCLSLPGFRGIVPRYTKIKYSGFDPHGNLISRIAEGFHARVVQHEYDHLDGILYPQRIKDMRYFGFEDEMASRISNNDFSLA
jgi:peptide deformylase